MCLFLTASKTDGRVPSQEERCTYNVQPYLLGRFPADVCPNITGQFGCGNNSKFSPSVGRGGGGSIRNGCCQGAKFTPLVGEGESEKGSWQVQHRRHSRHQIPLDTRPCLFPSNTFITRTFFFPNLPDRKNLPEEQVRWVRLSSVGACF